LTDAGGISEEAVNAALDRYSLQYMGVLDFYQTMLPSTPAPVILVPATAHYSWPRGAGISGIGIQQMLPVEVDLDGRMSMLALRRQLDKCLAEKRPVVMVMAVIGSTRESAVDPLADIVAIREEYREMGLDFAIHADAAWGGYFGSMLRPGKVMAMDSPQALLNDYVERQFDALQYADTITVDPHKAGFIPYPAGALCYRNSLMPGLITVVAEIVYHGGDAMTMGACALAGSSPGASTTAVYLSHLCIPPNRDGYGQILGRCVFNAKRFYAAVVTMPEPKDPFIVVPFKRIPAEVEGKTPIEVQEQLDLIKEKIVGFDNDVLQAHMDKDPDLAALFEALGPDLTVMNYAFNFKTAEGLNTDPVLMNELNMEIFRACSIEENTEYAVPEQKLILTQARFTPDMYGQAFCDDFARRLGVTSQEGGGIDYLISTMQNAWITNTSAGNFIPKLTEALSDIVTEKVAALVHRHGLTPYDPKKG
ncbi:MAG: pyridoxal-dependent decarboxylase, partial [Pseudomonadota bacterium]